MVTRPQLNHRLPRGGNRCDFCGGAPVLHLYGCTTFLFLDAKIFDKQMRGWWAACLECSALITGDLWGPLTDRVMVEVAKRPGISRPELELLRKSLVRLHKGFENHRLSMVLTVVLGHAAPLEKTALHLRSV